MDSFGVLILNRTILIALNIMLQKRTLTVEVAGPCCGIILILYSTQVTAVWYAAGSDVSEPGILDTKVAIVRGADGATFAKKRSICPGAGDNNEGIRR